MNTHPINKIHCAACGCFFASITAFDQHRTGSFRANTRRCLSAAEMLAAGFATEQRIIRFSAEGLATQGKRAVWYHAASRQRVRDHFRPSA